MRWVGTRQYSIIALATASLDQENAVVIRHPGMSLLQQLSDIRMGDPDRKWPRIRQAWLRYFSLRGNVQRWRTIHQQRHNNGDASIRILHMTRPNVRVRIRSAGSRTPSSHSVTTFISIPASRPPVALTDKVQRRVQAKRSRSQSIKRPCCSKQYTDPSPHLVDV